MIPRTRNGVFGAAKKKRGKLRKKHPAAARLARSGRSDMAQHHFSRTAPANRHEITDAAAHDQPCQAAMMTEEAMPVQESAREQAVAIFPGDQLAAMQVPGENKVIARTA